MRLLPKFKIAGLLVFLTGTWAGPSFSREESSTTVKAACTDKEEARVAGNLPKKIRNELQDVLSDAKDSTNLKKALSAMDRAVAFYQSKETPEAKLIGGYAIARLYLSLGYVHLSHQYFQSMLLQFSKSAAGSVGVKIAMASCLNEIHGKVSSITLDPQTLGALEALSKLKHLASDEPVIQQAQYHYLQQSLRNRRPVALSSYSSFQNPGEYALLGQALIFLNQKDKKKAAEKLTQYLRSPKPLSGQYEDMALLLLARIEAAEGQVAVAARLFKKVPKNSNYLPDALSDLGTLLLTVKRPAQAADALSNLGFGPLSRTFQPEGQVRLARSLTDLCQYPTALRILKEHNAKYGPIRSFLQTSVDEKSTPSMYRLIKQFQKNQLPSPEARMVVLEWMRSPVFIANQAEVNMMLQERETADKHRVQISEFKQQKSVSAGGQAFLDSLKSFFDGTATREKELVQEVETGLRRMARQMLLQVRVADDRAGLLEADILRLAGSQFSKYAKTIDVDSTGSSAAKEGKIAKSGKKTVLDWGRIPASELGDAEVWQDELGSVKAQLVNACSQKK